MIFDGQVQKDLLIQIVSNAPIGGSIREVKRTLVVMEALLDAVKRAGIAVVKDVGDAEAEV